MFDVNLNVDLIVAGNISSR